MSIKRGIVYIVDVSVNDLTMTDFHKRLDAHWILLDKFIDIKQTNNV